MDNFNFYSPTEFVFGKDRENETGALIKKHGGSRVLIHYGGGSAVKSGLLDRVKKSLDSEGIFYAELGGVTMSRKPPKKSDTGKSWMKPRRDSQQMISPEYHLIVS
ncbi:MAG: iron-containing alcohol dehydrogenase, partial [Ruminiclostridium sp.]|nr:iron-containing alcohol dehydrogenase [Ruminiclostridium sp.]